MEISQPNETVRPGKGWRSAEIRFQPQLEHRLNELKADIAERPFFYSGVAFAAGFLSNTFPARILFVVLMRVLSWLSVPAILVLGFIQLTHLFSGSPTQEPTLLQRP
jgi:hypothetical protein